MTGELGLLASKFIPLRSEIAFLTSNFLPLTGDVRVHAAPEVFRAVLDGIQQLRNSPRFPIQDADLCFCIQQALLQ